MSSTLYFEAPFQVAVRSGPQPKPGANTLLVASELSAVSAGTELLVYRGELPADLPLDETIAALQRQRGRYPLQYGYAAVGRVTAAGQDADPAWIGRTVFAFQPHQSHFIASPEVVFPLPEGLPVADGVFLPNMETAVSFVMDGRPVIGERVLIVGQGVVGLLTTALLAWLPLAALVVVDRYPARREMALALGATAAFDPAQEADIEAALGQADLTYELSGNPAALDLAIRLTGFGGRVVIGSWYGAKQAPLDLGGHFHRSHLQLISSQVSHLHPRWLGRWTKSRRLEVAWEMIDKIRPSRLITHRTPLQEAADLYRQLDQRPDEILQAVFTYS